MVTNYHRSHAAPLLKYYTGRKNAVKIEHYS